MNSSNEHNSSEGSTSQGNPSKSNQQRNGKGRKKINMMKIENETNLQVTFSKRKVGLFKKASELSTLCGAESAIVVFSPRGKAHSFGNPNVDTIANRFLNQNAPPTNDFYHLGGAHNNATMRLCNQELSRLEVHLKQEKEQRKGHKNQMEVVQGQEWCRPCIDDLNLEQLEELKNSILGFQNNLGTRVQDANNLVNSYVQGLKPEAGTNDNLSLPWTDASYRFDTSIQGGTSDLPLYGNNVPLVISGSTFPSTFYGGVGVSSNVIPTNPRDNSSIFPGYTPFYPTIGDYGYTFSYLDHHVGSSTNARLPYNYVYPDDVIQYGLAGGSSGVDLGEGSSRETQPNAPNMSREYNNKSGPRNNPYTN